MELGIPLICSDFELWRSIVDKHCCGICIDPEAPNKIADAIDQIIDNVQLADEMGDNGRAASIKCYSWLNESERLFKFYNYILS